MGFWILGGFILAVGAAVITLAWWKLGDQWADDEYKKFGHGGGRPRQEGPKPTVVRSIKNDQPSSESPSSDP
ncbi:MAG: hypothetical protein LAT64_14265 [Phycisphaerales bacterium]|nr:hypothetical protein [Planctomycetota bacterium]MCH8509916.1 hypothetical protein [Phycisphaerales bacterium]